MQALEFRAMNTDIVLAAEGQGWARQGLEATRIFIDDCEQRFSRFLPESELSKLNRSAGKWFRASEDLLELLEQSMGFYRETNAIFDPSILPDLKRTGYDRSMTEMPKEVAPRRSAPKPHSRPAFSEIEIDLPEQRVRLPRGMEIDLGGIAKGWIVDKAASMLSSYSGVCAVCAGGDMRFIGYPMGVLNWSVEVEDPRDVTQTVAVLQVGEEAVATSSTAKRHWLQGGQARHHLIDPRTGEPAESKWLSVTVIAPDIMLAEIYGKVLLIGGEEEAARLKDTHPELTYITVDADGNLDGSTRYMEYLNEYTYLAR